MCIRDSATVDAAHLELRGLAVDVVEEEAGRAAEEARADVPGPGKNWNVPALAEAINTPIVGNVLDAMNTDGRLDVLVQDDTKVVRMFLRLHYVLSLIHI